jgi:cation transport ATPase
MDSAWAEATGRTETWLRAAVAAAEAGIAHPIAAALCVQSATGEAGAHAFIVRDRQVAPGRGVVARLTPRDGIGDAFTVAVGEAELISSSKKNALGHADITGKSVWVFVDDQPAARVELAETWRVGLDDLWRELHALGITAEVMSGDREAERMFTNRGAESRLQVRGGLAPAAKQARMNELVKAGRCVAFFGDGVNDAAAMSVAHVSVAMRGGAELARAVAMAVFAGDDWRFIPRAIRVARAARRGIRANLWFAASYNLAGMALAATGRLHPVAAALLMVGSSAWVAVRAMRSSRVE